MVKAKRLYGDKHLSGVEKLFLHSCFGNISHIWISGQPKCLMVFALCRCGFMLTMTGYGVRATLCSTPSFILFFFSWAKSNTGFLCQKCGQYSVSSFKGGFLFYLV